MNDEKIMEDLFIELFRNDFIIGDKKKYALSHLNKVNPVPIEVLHGLDVTDKLEIID